VRRRNIPYREDLSGAAVRFAGTDNSASVADRLGSLGLGSNLSALLDRATPAARLEVNNLLASPRFAASPTLTAAALSQLNSTATLDQAGALQAAAAVTAAGAGAGLTRMEADTNVASDAAALQRLATSTDWKALDKAAAVAPARKVPQLAKTLSPDVVARSPLSPIRPGGGS
jgi:hypothetical protein